MGVEVSESGNNPACWRAVRSGSSWLVGIGEQTYAFGDARRTIGYRLRGALERVYDPGTVGLVFEAGPDNQVQAGGNEFVNLIISAWAAGPYLGDFQQAHVKRLPTKRHPKGRVNVLYSDMHGGSVQPVEFTGTGQDRLPSRYAPRVRVSPYHPHGF